MSADANRDGVEAVHDTPPTTEEKIPNAEDKIPHVEEKIPNVEEKIPQESDVAVIGSGSGSDTGEHIRGPNGEVYPTKEELESLRRVKGPINWIIYTIAFIELCERFAYYGTTAVFVNFISQPLPPGSTTGAGGTDLQAGALGQGQQASTGLVLFNSFWSYLLPLFGGWVADTYWGKYKTIHVAVGVALFGHIILIVSALPPVISNPKGALGCFAVGLIFFGIGVGLFKANISPMIAEQYESTQPRAIIKVLKSGERVVVDPILTISVIYMRYYFFINVGSLVGSIAMVYAEKYVGFWLSYTLPTGLFMLCPIVLLSFKNKYVRRPPTGSVLGKAVGLVFLSMKGRWSLNPITTIKNMRAPGFFERVKPSNIPEAERPAWMTFDDHWVDEVRRGFKACSVFVWYPLYWLSYNQISSNLTSQASSMVLKGVPNDVVNNLDPISLLIFIPIADKLMYPALRRRGINLTPIKKITGAFILATLSMVVAAIIQHYIYMQSPCRSLSGYGYIENCKDVRNLPDNAAETDYKAPLSVWIQTPAYVLVAFAEIGASITGLEYAFTKAPKNMRGFITGVFWFAQAFSAAIGQAFVPLATDPLLVWLYVTIAIVSALGGIGFWWMFSELDREEEALNALPDSLFKGSQNTDADFAAVEAAQAEQEKIRHAQGLDKAP
ncbi:PTR2-domain-containing protein [Hypoxylon trugodes]|uniref:PTR2-domain-containing protein n=1 Tax=Hypoxylon trugodes TaxID=326681 RepID=UPI0021903890|nr:PTR2-domain-containing protein [Hypoxylon trugodes]KAI1385416.1 PTR2-domain-containing protein [Hypoxylon trugodes]